MNREPSIEAVIFDFDGVIADTEPLHHQAFCAVVKADGLDCSWDEYVRDYIGFDDRDLFRAAYRKHGRNLTPDGLQRLVTAKAAAFMDLAGAGVETYDGIPDLIHYVAGRYPVGLCSGALRSDIDPILAVLGLSDAFRVIVTAEDVETSKPDPACYRLTVERLSSSVGRALNAGSCVAIEDTPGGVRAALDAGLRAWAVTHTHGPTDIEHAHRVFHSLQEVREVLEDSDE